MAWRPTGLGDSQRGEDRRLLGGPPFQQLPDCGAPVAPRLPETPAQAATQPGGELWEWAGVLRQSKVG